MKQPAQHTLKFYLSKGIEEIMGLDPVWSERTHETPEIDELIRQLDLRFGKTSRQGILIEASRAAFDFLLRDRGQEIGIKDTSFLMLPTRYRLKKGLQAIADWCNANSNLQCSLHDTPEQWTWITGYDNSKNDQSAQDACAILPGLVQGFLTWASGGKYYRVCKSSCRADGAAHCEFSIIKTPIE